MEKQSADSGNFSSLFALFHDPWRPPITSISSVAAFHLQSAHFTLPGRFNLPSSPTCCASRPSRPFAGDIFLGELYHSTPNTQLPDRPFNAQSKSVLKSHRPALFTALNYPLGDAPCEIGKKPFCFKARLKPEVATASSLPTVTPKLLTDECEAFVYPDVRQIQA